MSASAIEVILGSGVYAILPFVVSEMLPLLLRCPLLLGRDNEGRVSESAGVDCGEGDGSNVPGL